ncbi:hypothetical protein QBZ16_004394 [Prototheca wickerhamii]|uniref:Methyltransferase type 11 domain-containing protein n=1 Tax=Prototheca wickerhamii TaxID=3111 RepID=A0AAD9MGU8_PROWI|nr:hypothetical protein QBZ16_004394 [Prototheca wickerhamii]
MTTRAWQLLALSEVPAVLADFGCGSGLSTGVLAQLAGRKTSVMGLDAAGDMLCIAAKDPALATGLCLSDFREGAPLRPRCLDAAISISALQWLFVGSNGEVEVLLASASAAGFHALWIVDFPHVNPAKKYFFAALQTAGERVREEHARHADHAIRVLRRAATALLGGGLGEARPGRLLTLQGPAVRPLVPCAGPLHIWLSVHSTQADAEDSEAATLDAWSEAIVLGCRQLELGISCQTSDTTAAKGCGDYVHRLLSLGNAPTTSPANPWLGLAPMQSSPGALWLGRSYCQKQAPLLAVVARHSTGSDLSAHLYAAGRACDASGGAAVGIEVQIGSPGPGAHSALLLHIAHDDEAALESAARAWATAYSDAQREASAL